MTSTEGSNPLSRKINKILDMRLESDRELQEALKSLSTFFGENSLRNRKNLKSVIERRGLNINREFLADFAILKDQIETIRADVDNMNKCCLDMTERLQVMGSKFLYNLSMNLKKISTSKKF